MKVDLVYLWVNGQDPSWAKKRLQHQLKADNVLEIQEVNVRSSNNEELRYSLRSIDRYAPWINHIFIVTDNQTPSWLDTNNKKISIIDHKEIMPLDALPCFNSCALELAICNIPSLSEHFLYANDDMMLARNVNKDYFFNSEGKVKCRFLKAKSLSESQLLEDMYEYTLVKASEKIAKDFSREDVLNFRPHHQIDAYNKSNLKECLSAYHEWSDSTIHSTFRSLSNMQRHILTLYCAATNQGEILLDDNLSTLKRLFTRIKVMLRISKGINSKIIPITTPSNKTIFYVKMFKPALVCFNDSGNATEQIRAKLKQTLEKIYPHKSQFEL